MEYRLSARTWTNVQKLRSATTNDMTKLGGLRWEKIALELEKKCLENCVASEGVWQCA